MGGICLGKLHSQQLICVKKKLQQELGSELGAVAEHIRMVCKIVKASFVLDNGPSADGSIGSEDKFRPEKFS